MRPEKRTTQTVPTPLAKTARRIMSTTPFAPRGDKKTIEEGLALSPKFDDKGLITAVTCDHLTNEVLMVAYMNEEAFAETIATRQAVYFSRSRQKLWRKGEESGHVQKVKYILIDCDQDALVLKVEQIGGACCHVGYRSCFYRSVKDTDALEQAQAEKAYDPAKVYGKK